MSEPSARAGSDLDEGPDYQVVIIGAGVTGIYQAKRLKDVGVPMTVLEANADLGGTWYNNRYPGARFDSESFTYGYSFSQEVLDEWHWTEQFSPQPENLRYLNYVVDKFELRPHMQFGCRVKSMVFDDGTDTWTLGLDDGRTISTRFVATAVGVLSAPTLPRFEGMDSFEGASFHAFHWPHDPIDLRGKRVAVVGTGATAIQLIPEVAKEAARLTVFQRRPNWAAPLNNAPISASEMAAIRTRYDEIFATCARTPRGVRARTRPARLLRRERGGAARLMGQALRRTGLRNLASELRRDLHRRGRQRRVLRVHRGSDPATRTRS